MTARLAWRQAPRAIEGVRTDNRRMARVACVVRPDGSVAEYRLEPTRASYVRGWLVLRDGAPVGQARTALEAQRTVEKIVAAGSATAGAAS